MKTLNLTITIITLLIFNSSIFSQKYWKFNDEEKQYFQTVKKVRVIVEDTVSHLPFLEYMKAVLTDFGYEPVDKTSKTYDATLIVPITVDALDQVYHAPGLPFQVNVITGVSLYGNMILCFSDKIFHADFSSSFQPPDTTEEYDFDVMEDFQKKYHVKGRLIEVPYREVDRNVRDLMIPGKLPFDKAFNAGLFSAIINHFADNKGYNYLFNAVKDQNKIISDAALLGIKSDHSYFKPDFLYQCLDDPDTRVRITAINTLLLNNDTGCVDRFLTMLDDKDQIVKKEIIFALGKLKKPKVVKPLLALLKDQDTSVIRALAVTLANFPKYSTKELNKIKSGQDKLLQGNINYVNKYIENAEKNINYYIRLHKIKNISNVCDSNVIIELINALGDYTVSDFASEEIIKHGDAAVDLLIAALKNPNEKNCEEIISCLGKIKNPKALPVLINTLNDSSLWIKKKAIYAIGELGDPAAIPTLELLLNDKEEDIRYAATIALGGINDPRAFELLIQRLRKGEGSSYSVALSECSSIIIDTLITLLNSNDSRVIRDIQYITDNQRDTILIRKIVNLIEENIMPSYALTPSTLVKYLKEKARKYFNEYDNQYEYVVHPLVKAELRDTSAIESLIICKLNFDYEIEEIPFDYVYALKKFDGFVTTYLIDKINDPNTENLNRIYYIQILGKLCDINAIDTLIKLRESENKSIQTAANDALWELIGQFVTKDWYNNFKSYF
jgi:HEAT repeat protein